MLNKAKTPKLHCIDLFAGCGGLSLGLEQAGFLPVFVNELNTDARESYLINRDYKNPKLRETFNSADIKDLILNEDLRHDLTLGLKQHWGLDLKKGDLDLLTGGPPCQGYSGIGYRRSYSVDRQQLPSNHLYQDMAYLVSAFRPKIFLFENVKGLLTARWTKAGKSGEIWRDVLQTFNALKEYEIRFKLVRAKDYNVPQNRPRVLMVGIRDDINSRYLDRNVQDSIESGFLPKPTTSGGKGAPDIRTLLGDLVDFQYQNGGSTDRYPESARAEIQRYFRAKPNSLDKYFKKGDPVTEHKYSKHSDRIIEKFSYMVNHQGQIPLGMQTKKFAQRWLPPKWKEGLGPSITATSLPDDYVHYCQPRSLTVREWARLQTFPDWYQFAGKRTTGGVRRAGNPREGMHYREVPKYTQIGNAVPVNLSRIVGEHFRKILLEN